MTKIFLLLLFLLFSEPHQHFLTSSDNQHFALFSQQWHLKNFIHMIFQCTCNNKGLSAKLEVVTLHAHGMCFSLATAFLRIFGFKFLNFFRPFSVYCFMWSILCMEILSLFASYTEMSKNISLKSSTYFFHGFIKYHFHKKWINCMIKFPAQFCSNYNSP